MIRASGVLVLCLAVAFPARAQEEHQTIHAGVMVGPALPRALDGEVFVKYLDLVSLGFSYSDFPNFLASPLLDAFGANSNGTQARLDEFSAYEADLRIYPFRGPFFFGSSLGHQSLRGAVTQTTVVGPVTGSVDIATIYATPRVGFLWAFDSGFLVGVDAGAQFKLSNDVKKDVPPGAPASVNDNINKFVDATSILPSFHFRIGWQY
jgi:hypothetical protein